MTLLLQPSDLHIIHKAEPLSATCTVNPGVNLLVTRVSSETCNGIGHSHIKIALFISMTLTICVFPFSHQP